MVFYCMMSGRVPQVLAVIVIGITLGFTACNNDAESEIREAEDAFIKQALTVYLEIHDFGERYEQVRFLHERIVQERRIRNADGASYADFLRVWLQVAMEREKKVCIDPRSDCEIGFVRGAIRRVTENELINRVSSGQMAVWQRLRSLVKRGSEIEDSDMAKDWKNWTDGELNFTRDTFIRENTFRKSLFSELASSKKWNIIFGMTTIFSLLINVIQWFTKTKRQPLL